MTLAPTTWQAIREESSLFKPIVKVSDISVEQDGAQDLAEHLALTSEHLFVSSSKHTRSCKITKSNLLLEPIRGVTKLTRGTCRKLPPQVL